VMSAINALAAHVTTRGDRYTSFAMLGVSMDVIRIVFPVLVSGAVILGNSSLAILLIIVACVILFFLSSALQSGQTFEKEQAPQVTEKIRGNKNFLYVITVEFFDSFSSSQLFVFLPLLFLAKGYSLESSLLLQSFIFLGYIVGRWFVSFLAKRYSGMKAISYAEFGMVVTIILLLTVQQMWTLYLLSFLLGVFVRGTSPAIKAVAFDTLNNAQMKRGSAVHVVAGDSGSALGQLLFGFLVAWYGANSPFIVAAIVALFIGIVSFVKPIRINKVS
ncbi:MAG TPA: MFS transporter, partial [Patescibacteria group bacterium]|nr:MFS transporter [Patescibacteria group bacterium]